MVISESRLRQVIREEITARIIEQYIDQELDKFLLEVDADWDKAKRKATKAKIAKGLGGAGLATAVGLGLQGKVDDLGQAKRAAAEKTQQKNYEASSTIDNSVKDLKKQAGNFNAWTWQTNKDQTLPFPTNPENKSEAVLPLEWSVLAQVTQDLGAQTPQYNLNKNFLQVANNPDSLASAYKNIKGKSVKGKAANFFSDFSPDTFPFSDASEVGAHQFKSPNPGVASAMIDLDGDGAPDAQNLVYVPFDEIPDDYVMPLSGLTKAELYKKYYYGHGMSLEMFKKLKGQIKESRITWRNYKNRKKKLA